MNGRINEQIVLDTNTAINFIDRKIAVLPEGKRFVSVITEMELFAFPSLRPEDEEDIRDFLSLVIIVPLKEQIKKEAIRIRRYGKPRLKLPDAGQFGFAELPRSFGNAKTPYQYLHGVSA